MNGYGSVGDKVEKGAATCTSNQETTPLISERDEDIHASVLAISSWWTKLTFGWFGPLLVIGNEKGKLDPKDLHQVPFPSRYNTSAVATNFEKYWKEELRAAAQHPESSKTANAWFTAPSLLRSIARTFGREYMQAGLLKLCHDACIFVGPQVLHGLIIFLGDPNARITQGLRLTLVVTVSQLIMSFCLRHYFYKCYVTGLQVRTCVVTAVYNKALTLGAGERQMRTTGEITNLMSIDAQRLQDLTNYLHAVWYSFVQIGLALFFLWKLLGSSCLGGVAVIIVMIPVSKMVAKWIGSMQKILMKARDKRVELNSEVLGNMKVIKLQAWEEPFQERILALRNAELDKLLNYIFASCISMMLWSATPLAVSLATFASYVLSGHKLDVATALTALALFDILRFPLFMLPNVINNIVEASVSFDRVRSFLMCNNHNPTPSGDLSENGISMDEATFAYETNKPKIDKPDADPTIIELNDTKWELALLRSQLQDAESRIKELAKEDSLIAKEDTIVKCFDTDEPYNLLCLKRINLETKGAELVAVVGGVGCGKSSLINAILGEMRSLSGTTFVKGKIGYFSQAPFILNSTVRDNILFGHVSEPFDEAKYKRALDCCALTHDLKMLPAGDMTEIGEKGITLSGGQKARVAMARVVYHNADICLLDDPLAAVDAHVGKHIFQKGIVDELLLGKGSIKPVSKGKPVKKRTIILVTNALQYLSNPMVDRIVVVRDGRVVEQGTYTELSSAESEFARFLAVMNETGGTPEGETSSTTPIEEVLASSLNKSGDLSEQPEVAKVLTPTLRRRSARKVEFIDHSVTKDKPPALMTDENREREVGHVDSKVYMAWAKAAGGPHIPVLLFIGFAGVECLNISSKWWLTYWSQHGGESQNKFLAVYALITLAAVLLSFCRVFLILICGLRASRVLFTRMLESILQAPMCFFDTTPTGRIVNRFSKDMYTIDEQIVSSLRSYLSTLFAVMSTIIVISYTTPVFTICLIPIIMFYLIQQNYFTKTYRELKRLDSVNRSPLYALLGETLDGVASIRSFDAQDYLSSRLVSILDTQQHAYFLTCTAQCWLAIRLELVGTLIITFAALCSVLQHGRNFSLEERESFAGLAGLSISFALTVTQSLNWSVRMGSDFEANMVAVERIEQYARIQCEAPRKTDAERKMSSTWPSGGEIKLSGVKLRYRPGLPLVLKGLDLHIPAGSKVGVVGRTGAGKSTVMLALLRIVELDSGKIHIDGVDIRSLGLSVLRSKIAVVPQDPVLFSGTIGTNLDPFDEFSNDKLYDVLTRVGLYTTLRASSSAMSLSSMGQSQVQSLSEEVTEGGSNFSVGQRQLLVIARALLCGATIVVMDEATAAVDADTDARIQRVMRTEFVNATCITVAHRLNTIMDSDYILVMEDGQAAEFDPPGVLLQRGGMFSDLVEAASNEEFLE